MPSGKSKSPSTKKEINIKRNKNNKPTIRSMFLKMLAGFYFVVMILFIAFHLYYANKIIPGVYVNDTYIGGMEPEEAINSLLAEYAQDKEVRIVVGDSYYKTVSMNDIEFKYLPVETVKEAFKVGRSFDIYSELITRVKSPLAIFELDPLYSYNPNALSSELSVIKSEGLDRYVEPEYFINEDGVLNILPGRSGESFDEGLVSDQVLEAFRENQNKDIEVEVLVVNPQLKLEDLDLLQSDLEMIINKNITLVYDDRIWNLTPTEILEFVKPIKNDASVQLDVNKTGILAKLDELANEIDRNPRGQVLQVKDDKAVMFVESQDGLRLKIKESSENITKGVFEDISEDVEVLLAVEVTTPPPADNEYGLEEIIGVGTSKFKGSDNGRVTNIGVASEKIHGVMVPPGGDFSFAEAVGEISKRTGYTSAWIISKGRTILGDGGGVCQVSTTIFRAALDAGLPIVERNAHSYRVGYYEQDSAPGVDATVYVPSVDLVFKNDTPGYILIATELDKEGYALKFTIYGQDDGREVEITEPKIISRSAPPAPTYIDDPSLPKGVTKQVEYPVSGAKVVFTRTVKRDGEIIIDDNFTSNYRAWGAVYNVGTKE